MPPPTRLAFFSPELTFVLDPSCARGLFAAVDAHGLADTAVANPDDPFALARVLWGKPIPLRVADALDELARLGTPAGRDALIEAARDTGAPHDTWEDEAPLDVAARLLAERANHHDVLVRAHLRLARLLPERPTYELRGASARKVPALRPLREALCAVAGAGWSDVWVHEDDDGAGVATGSRVSRRDRLAAAEGHGPEGCEGER